MFEDMSELSNDQLDARLAVYTAVGKVAYQGEKLAKKEATQRMLAASKSDEKTMKRAVTLGGQQLGYLTKAKDSVDVYDADEYGLWAAEHHRGRKYIRVDVTDDVELEEILTKWLAENDATWKFTAEADKDLKKGFAIRGIHVVDQNGEMVPGCGVKTGNVTYRDCKPEEVASVLKQLGQDMSVVGFLDMPTLGLLGE